MKSIFRLDSLVFKVICVTSLILIIAISFSAWLVITLHEESIKKLTYEKTKIISEFIEKNVIRTMERGKHFEIHRILKNFTVYRGIKKINLFQPDGMIRASTDDEELNKNIGDVDYYLKNQYFVREETVRGEGGRNVRERIYYFNSPILNKPECFSCHREGGKIIGILTVANSLKEMDGEISKAKRDSLVIATVTIGSLALVLGLLFLRFINLPIRKLTDAMEKVKSGDLSVRANLRKKDEMGRLAENLNAMIQRLDSAKKEAERYHHEQVKRADRMASIGELASGIAHEIRNPLAGIQGAIQILAEDFSKGDNRRQITDEIQKQIKRLERLVKDMLSFVKPLPSNYSPTDVNELVDKILSFFLTQRGKSENFRIERRFFSPLPKVLIDPNSMEQAFLNIILNAKNAMPQEGTFIVSTSSITQKLNGGDGTQEVQIIFEDTGIGISKDNLPRIFNPFFSTRSEGTGLGLYITKNIVEEHGGNIKVESHVNVGTRFIITLPAMKQ